jgi:phosphotransferase system IIA component
MELDLDFLGANAKSMTSPIIVTDIDESKIDVMLKANGEVKAGEALYDVTIYE